MEQSPAENFPDTGSIFAIDSFSASVHDADVRKPCVQIDFIAWEWLLSVCSNMGEYRYIHSWFSSLGFYDFTRT